MSKQEQLIGRSVYKRYMMCLMQGLPGNTGVPDCNNKPSLVFNRHFINTLKPNASGQLKFTVMVSPNGVIHQVAGAAFPGTWYILAPSSPSGVTATAMTHNTNLVFNPVVYQATEPSGSYRGTMSWRVVNACHTVEFTGSSLHNGGSVVVNEISPDFSMNSIVTSGIPRPAWDSKLLATNYTVPTARTLSGPARNSFTLMHLPVNTAYQDADEVLASGSVSELLLPYNSAIMAPHRSCRIYSVEYNGLSTDASVTITSRVCIQQTIDPNDSMRCIAKPSEATDVSLLENTLRAIGSSRLLSWGKDAAASIVKGALSEGFSAALALL